MELLILTVSIGRFWLTDSYFRNTILQYIIRKCDGCYNGAWKNKEKTS